MILKATQKVVVGISFKDAEGNAATIDGVPTWGVSDPAVGELEVAADGLSATLRAGSPSVGTVNVSVDADLGDGVKTITGQLDVTVVPGDAVVVEVVAGQPEDQ